MQYLNLTRKMNEFSHVCSEVNLDKNCVGIITSNYKHMLLFVLWHGALMQCDGMWKKFFFTFERMWYKLTSKSICEETDEKFYWMEFPIATCVYKCFFSYIYSYNILSWRVKLNDFVIYSYKKWRILLLINSSFFNNW